MEQHEQQRLVHDERYKNGVRAHVNSEDILIRYLVRWRLRKAIEVLTVESSGAFTKSSRILVLCSGEGLEGSILADDGFLDVTVSDISPMGMQQATSRDTRLKTLVINVQDCRLPDGDFDLVIVQDGLHHLQSPVSGFTEMLRLSRYACFFLEPHDSWIGNKIGTKWEINSGVENFVFRWNKELVEQVASSYLGRGSFRNLSFSFFHHNIVLERIGRKMGGCAMATYFIAILKKICDVAFGRAGNQFCGMIIKTGGARRDNSG